MTRSVGTRMQIQFASAPAFNAYVAPRLFHACWNFSNQRQRGLRCCVLASYQ
ncbi:MAG: hypothetical protein EZS28_051254, partial [Streblomastix strix]